jgi:short-subunit dehydrogenase
MACSMNQKIAVTDWPGLRVWLIGASTGIGAALAESLSALGANLILSARNLTTLEEVRQRCLVSHPSASLMIQSMDVCDDEAVSQVLSQIEQQWGGVDLVLFNAGTYEAVRADTLNGRDAERALQVNLLAPIRATALILPKLISASGIQKPKGIAYVASVAGYRGLPRALTYGPGKAGLISFAESLWIDLHAIGLNVWLINPGFVRTRLTAQNSFEMPALIEPEEAANEIIRGFARGSFEIHFPKRFTRFMKLMRLLPIGMYLRLTQRLVPPLSPRPIAATPLTRTKDTP